MKNKLKIFGALAVCGVTAFVATNFLGHANSNEGQASQREQAPTPVNLTMCKDPNSAWKSFRNKYMLEVMGDDFRATDVYKRTDLSTACKEVTVMSNDYITIPRAKGTGNEQHQRKYPSVFEVFVVDAGCERQCIDKASGWVSSYELPLEFWPEGEEWLESRANRLIMEGQIGVMAASNEAVKHIKEYPQDERLEMYNRAVEAYRKGLQFMRNYNFY